ncbi:hypothetical protein [Streptomyces sp. NPDC090022]|uniref:hypothetical protein n=1 Tax=Streptomyces sp. NPDC090022 TaxID=3365920 RepID=UPI00381C66B6
MTAKFCAGPAAGWQCAPDTRDGGGALHRLARADATTGQDAVERAYCAVQDLVLATGRITDAGTAALPFLVELALAPGTVARPDLAFLLAELAENGAADGTGSEAGPRPVRGRGQVRGQVRGRGPGVGGGLATAVAPRTDPDG